MHLARTIGAHDPGDYARQLHVPDFVAHLRLLAPALEGRIEASPFAGITRELRLNRYQQTIGLRSKDGHLGQVVDLGALPTPRSASPPPNGRNGSSGGARKKSSAQRTRRS